jgi:hypothetical protein
MAQVKYRQGKEMKLSRLGFSSSEVNISMSKMTVRTMSFPYFNLISCCLYHNGIMG